MEMHQIRYFLAVSRVLNFTRAAEECNVSQPSLTRAVQMLEAELGGELFLRERNLTHLSELGARMLPLIQQCYDSAVSAKSLAKTLKSGSLAPLKLALSLSINIALVLPPLTELSRTFKGLELKFMRGSGPETEEALKKGAADLAVAGPLRADWERLDRWPLFTEGFVLAVNENHRLANRGVVNIEELKAEPIVRRAHCECVDDLDASLRVRGIVEARLHEAESEGDVAALLAANVGIAIVPASAALPTALRRIRIDGLDQKRSVSVYAVAGRSRSAVAGSFLNMLRAADWSAYACVGPRSILA
jgi:DNA-binding transcriptional LysR family regulator